MDTDISSILDTDNELVEHDAEKMKKNEIDYYKTALKLYQATSLSLAAISQKMRSAYELPNHLSPNEILQAKIQDLHNNVALLKCLADVTHEIHGNYVVSDVINTNNPIKSQMEQANNEIAYFSKAIINLYSNQCNEFDQIERGKSYIEVLEYYQNHLAELKSSSTTSDVNQDEAAQLDKCKNLIEKINLIRSIKALLIGNLAIDTSRLPELQKLRSSSRRNLTLEDFKKTWDVCYN